MKNALVIGGIRRFIDEKVAPKLAQRGVQVTHHWAMDRQQVNVDPPAGTEVVVLFKDMCPVAGSMGQHMVKWCKKAGAIFIATTRKAAIFCGDFDQAGLKVVYGPEVPMAEILAPVEVAAPAEPPTMADGVILPTWLMQHIKSGEPIELEPGSEREKILFELGRERTFTALIRISPALASVWTDRNKANRPLSEARVDKLAAAFRRGEYRVTHQGMAFGRNGVLQDGQHRLWAIATAPITLDAFVTFGQPVEAIPVIDDVNRRKVYQNRIIVSTLNGMVEANAKKMTEAAKVISLILMGAGSDAVATTYDEIDSIVKMFDGGIVWAASLPARKIFMPSTVRAALAFAFKTNEVKVKEFAQQVLDGENLSRGMPAYILRQGLANVSPRSDAGRREQAVKALRATMAYINCESLPKLFAAEEAVAFFGKAHGFRQLGKHLTRRLEEEKEARKEERRKEVAIEAATELEAKTPVMAVPPIIRKHNA